ncbi:extracellular solute-binding protein [Streptococcus pneumoniae]|nr:extracellular solute-binding protein [Streptococcus pneumoniae]
MKNWKKYAFASASVVALAAGLAACGNLTGNSKKAADSGDKPVIKMYQIGDKPDNLDELLANANKIIEEKVGAKLDIQYLGWGDYGKKMWLFVNCSGLKSAKLEKGQNSSFLF